MQGKCNYCENKSFCKFYERLYAVECNASDDIADALDIELPKPNIEVELIVTVTNCPYFKERIGEAEKH